MGAVLAIGEVAQSTYDSHGKTDMYGSFAKTVMVSPESGFPRLLMKVRNYIDFLERGRGKSDWAKGHNGGRSTGIRLSRELNSILVSDEMQSRPVPVRLTPREQTEFFLGYALMNHNLYTSSDASGNVDVDQDQNGSEE
jgi:hypothetical protein